MDLIVVESIKMIRLHPNVLQRLVLKLVFTIGLLKETNMIVMMVEPERLLFVKTVVPIMTMETVVQSIPRKVIV